MTLYEPYEAPDVQKAYLDTNIIIAYVSGSQKDPFQYPKARQIFDEIRQGKYIGVISTLMLIEMKGVLRTLLGRERAALESIPAHKQPDYVKDEATEQYKIVLAELLRLPYIKFEKGKQSNLQSVLEEADQIMDDIKGSVRFYDKCGICRSQFKNSVYKQILAADILHALLAKDTGCDMLITFDKGFAALTGNSQIGTMQIMVR